MVGLRRLAEPDAELAWLSGRPDEEWVTGLDPSGWDASVWVLHAMYENRSLRGLGSHDEVHGAGVMRGLRDPLIIGDVNLDEVTTVSGVPLGWVVRPGTEWTRVLWASYLARTGSGLHRHHQYPPSSGWFPAGSWPVSIAPPPEGSLDEASLVALIDVLAAASPGGADTDCCAFFASLPTGDFDTRTVWSGPLRAVVELVDSELYPSSPTNLWPMDHSWFVWTDWDLMATKLSGSPDLIERARAHPDLETASWPTPS